MCAASNAFSTSIEGQRFAFLFARFLRHRILIADAKNFSALFSRLLSLDATTKKPRPTVPRYTHVATMSIAIIISIASSNGYQFSSDACARPKRSPPLEHQMCNVCNLGSNEHHASERTDHNNGATCRRQLTSITLCKARTRNPPQPTILIHDTLSAALKSSLIENALIDAICGQGLGFIENSYLSLN